MKCERIEVAVTDGIAWLVRLSPRQMISIGDRLWTEQRKQMILDMKEAEVDSAERMVALREHERKRGLMSEIIGHAVTTHGALEIIAEATKSEHAENAEGLPDNFDGTSEDAIRIALELIGTELSFEDESDSKKKK